MSAQLSSGSPWSKKGMKPQTDLTVNSSKASCLILLVKSSIFLLLISLRRWSNPKGHRQGSFRSSMGQVGKCWTLGKRVSVFQPSPVMVGIGSWQPGVPTSWGLQPWFSTHPPVTSPLLPSRLRKGAESLASIRDDLRKAQQEDVSGGRGYNNDVDIVWSNKI